ncbi:type II toxin-antitoxin system VapC family toxin [Algoriphagus sp.]|jgi:predicted nucleic acid-binding protein|uniref:type II toxin-antitoxin system VapC family toxin n=1 Tax=Algoriphagus sp. TaxID=1872435 RepID=UPI002724E9A8|nr:type II toxin-antitoxin system VapC family toxin [Algoriphagus sp.]MDO8966491.1 type II toxin-antitoxin system VapC family toxin [Algoriphagus sp.]MDP3201937.1 type II toxin-antitoxin system VapC family toxin [Algoriphagus sp.]
MGGYLIDSNIISDYFSENLTQDFLDFLDPIFEKSPCLSIISQIELLSWKADPTIESLIQEFISDSRVFELSQEIISTCIAIRRNYSIKTPDAIIAATAIVEDLVLITKNIRDFSKIKGLRILNTSDFV